MAFCSFVSKMGRCVPRKYVDSGYVIETLSGGKALEIVLKTDLSSTFEFIEFIFFYKLFHLFTCNTVCRPLDHT